MAKVPPGTKPKQPSKPTSAEPEKVKLVSLEKQGVTLSRYLQTLPDGVRFLSVETPRQ